MLEWVGVITEDRERLARFMWESADRMLSSADEQYIREELRPIAAVVASFEKKFVGGNG